MKSDDIRQSYIDFFVKKHGHTFVPSSPLLPADDPTLLFANAGMNQFKNIFLGLETRDYKRAVNSQKCIRAGGKHDDLEEVGFTARHHTFFEMLGNWSFGDYFKHEAITWAWDWVTNVLGMAQENLIATIYEEDDESHDIWENEIGLPESRIVRCGEKDNFWTMTEIGGGPCGPCSEIIYDLGDEMSCGGDCAIGVCDCDRWLEIWNLVFMQFNAKPDGSREKLPKTGIDTGAGLERIAAIMQGVKSNYETDLFSPIIRHIEGFSGVNYDNSQNKSYFHIVADHVRALCFAIADGILPSNDGRGYVLRRILRRAVWHSSHLRIATPLLLAKIADTVIEIMSHVYPELAMQRVLIQYTLEQEENAFNKTLDRGNEYIEELVEEAKSKGRKTLNGQEAHYLKATLGFPIDLTQLIAQKHGLNVDIEDYENAMLTHAEISSGTSAKSSFIINENFIGLNKAKSELESKLREYVEKNPNAHNNSGIKYVEENNFEEAIKEFNIAIRLNPKFAEAHNNIGATRLRKMLRESNIDQREIMKAVDDFSRAIEIKDNYAEAYTGRGVAYYLSDNLIDAESDLIKASNLSPRNPAVHENLGATRIRLGKFHEAISDLRKAIEIQPEYADAHDWLGTAQFATGDYENAIRSYKRALEIDKRCLNAKKNLELVLSGKKPSSLTSYKGGIESEIITADLDLPDSPTEFVGYINYTIPTGVPSATYEKMILEETPFYPESGGQAGDVGKIYNDDFEFIVIDTKKAGQHYVHVGKVLKGKPKKGMRVIAEVDLNRRRAIMRAHTATHLMHAALKEIVGEHVNQAGSEVLPDSYRFDLTHPKALTRDEIKKVEQWVNDRIQENLEVRTEMMPLDEAKKRGVTALFGEKYGETVRVVSIHDGEKKISAELCGGTHARRTGDIGAFKIVKESALQAGVRRVFAKTGTEVIRDMQEMEEREAETMALLKAPSIDMIPKRIEDLQKKLKEKKKAGAQAAQVDLKGLTDVLMKNAFKINDVRMITYSIKNLPPAELRKVGDFLRDFKKDIAFCIASEIDGKVNIAIGFTKDLVGKGLDAGKMIKEVAQHVGGGGGGRPDFATAGGKNPAGIEKALKNFVDAVEKKLRE